MTTANEDIPAEPTELEAMRKDAERYEWLREHLDRLIVHTDQDSVILLELGTKFRTIDAGSIDRAIDNAIAQELGR
jgi:hypothetical protein